MSGTLNMQKLQDFLRHFANMISTAALYDPEHPRVKELLPQAGDALSSLMRGLNELNLVMVKDDLLIDGKPLERSPTTMKVARELYRHNIGFVRFLSGVTAGELHLLVRVALGNESPDAIKNFSLKIRIGDVDASVEEQIDDPVRPIASFEDLTPEELQGLKDFYSSLQNRGKLNVRQVSTLIAGFVAAFKQEVNPLLALVPLRMEDEYTFVHSVNVGILNVAQGISLGLDGDLLHDVGVAGMMHDAGKIFIDKEILRKPGSLTDEEFEKMKAHPSRGAQYLMNQEGVPRLAVVCAFEHHMRYNKTGYPAVPEYWNLNLCSQMTMISDTFDALRTRRSYKEPWDFPKISGLMLKLAGKELNPHLTLNFLQVISRYGDGLMTDGPERPHVNPCC